MGNKEEESVWSVGEALTIKACEFWDFEQVG
jgi:hypothetical protein